MNVLLVGLPLQPDTSAVPSGVDGTSSSNFALEDDIYETLKGPLFQKYLSFFLKVLHKCRVSEVPSF